MITVETTSGCLQTPRVLFLLEELEQPYELVSREGGYFLRVHRRPGPLYMEGGLVLFEGNTMIRHVGRVHGGEAWVPSSPESLAAVDGWLDFTMLRLGVPAGSLMGEVRASEPSPARIAEHRSSLERGLAVLDAALDGRKWLCATMTIADAAMVVVALIGQRLDLSPFPNVRTYAERLSARPAFARAMHRIQSLSASAPRSPHGT
jgi:glutathione S-transferase